VNKYEELYDRPRNPHGHDEFYKLSFDEYDAETNTYLNLYSQKVHQAFAYGYYSYFNFYSSVLNSQTAYGASYIGSEYGLYNKKNYNHSTVNRDMRGLKYFFFYEKQYKELPLTGSGEYVLDGFRYYYQPEQNVTITYPAYNPPQGFPISSRTETFKCKAGWYSLNTPISFPTDKVGYIPDVDPFNAYNTFTNLPSNTYINGSARWVYTQGQWLRYVGTQSVANNNMPLINALSFTQVLKYVNKGGYREYTTYGTAVVNYDLVPIETYNSEQLLFDFGPSDINLSDNTITISETASKFLRTGMLLTFAPADNNSGIVWPTRKETTVNAFEYKWPTESLYSSVPLITDPNSPATRPKTLGVLDSGHIQLAYIEKISSTKIRLFPNYSERIVFGQNQKPNNQFRFGYSWTYGFYDQPYFDNQKNNSSYFFINAGSNYRINAYRLIEDYPDGTALLPVEIAGLYPHYQQIKTGDVDYGVMFWSWLDSRYVDLQQNRIKSNLFSLPNYNNLVKDYSTGTRITVRVASQIFPMSNVARARFAFSENIPTLSGQQTIQGVKVFHGDYVLLLGQADASQNHLYYVQLGAWDKITPYNDSLYNVSTYDIAEYYSQYAIVGVDTSFANEKKYTVYRARFTYTSMLTKTYVSGWEKQAHDGSLETPYIKTSYYSFASRYSTGSYPISPNSFELKGFSELPKPLIENGVYYLIKNGEYISFADSYENAVNNIPITLESIGKGILAINSAPKTNSGYLEKIVTVNPEVVESLDDKAVYLINKKGGSFQLADSKENALAKIPMKVKVRPNDYFALVKAEDVSQPKASIFTRDQKYFSWDVDNPSNKQFQRPNPKYLNIDASDVAGILDSNLSITKKSFTLTSDEANYPLTRDNPDYYYDYYYNGYNGYYGYYGYYGYGYGYPYGYYGYYNGYPYPYYGYPYGYYYGSTISPYNFYGNVNEAVNWLYRGYYFNSYLDYYIFLNGTSREMITRMQYVVYNPAKVVGNQIIYNEYIPTKETLPYNFPDAPPTTVTITKLGLTSSSSWKVAVATTDEQKMFLSFTISNGIDSNLITYYRKYTTSNTQAIIDAIINDMFSVVNPSEIKFFKNVSTVNDYDYFAASSTSRNYITSVTSHRAILVPEIWKNTMEGFVPPANYSGVVWDYNMESQAYIKYEEVPVRKESIGASCSYTAKIYSTISVPLTSGVDVGIPGRYTDKAYPNPFRYSKAVVSAGMAINPSSHPYAAGLLSAKLNFSATANYTFNGTIFVKDASDSPYNNLFPNSFTVTIAEYYFPRTSLKLDFTDSVKHIWKKSFMTIAVPPRYTYGDLKTNMYFDPKLNAKNITSADYEESASDVGGSIILNWNASQKRYQSSALSSKGVKFRCEALIGRIMKDKQISGVNSNFGSTNPILEASPYSKDFTTICLFGSPNTWMEFTGVRALTNVTTSTNTTDYSETLIQAVLDPLKLDDAVSANNTKGSTTTQPHPIFSQFNISPYYQPLINNGYELAITDIPLNRHPCWDTAFDMDLQNWWNLSANNKWDATYGSGVSRDFTLKGWIYTLMTPSASRNGMLPHIAGQSMNLFSPPTIEIVSSTGIGGQVNYNYNKNQIFALTAFGIDAFSYVTSGFFQIVTSGKNYVGASSSTATNSDYVKINVVPAVFTYAADGYTVTSMTAGTPVTYYALIVANTTTTTMVSSSLYPYASLGIDGETPVPHISAPVTIGLIKKISFQ
jgi:hypothetical protein